MKMHTCCSHLVYAMFEMRVWLPFLVMLFMFCCYRPFLALLKWIRDLVSFSIYVGWFSLFKQIARECRGINRDKKKLKLK